MTPELTFCIDVPPRIVVGAPFMVSLTVTNPRAERTYYTLAEISRFGVPPPVELWVAREGSESKQVLPAQLKVRSEDEPSGMTLRPHESRQCLYDVSELWPNLDAGAWTLGGRYLSGSVPAAHARTCTFEVLEPTPDAAAALASLRARHESGDEPSWNAVLLANFREIEDAELDALDEPSRAAIGLHLWMHCAVYGATGLAAIDPHGLDVFAADVQAGEVEALRHELLVARTDSGAAAQAAAIIERWPGLAWRIEDNDTREGLLALLRRSVGAERSAPSVPSPLPYSV